jgi:hypothetical protein
LVGWFIGLLVGWFIGLLVGWLVGWLMLFCAGDFGLMLLVESSTVVQYDVVILDAYQPDDTIPSALVSRNMLQHIRDTWLSPCGVVLLNIAEISSGKRSLDNFASVFAGAAYTTSPMPHCRVAIGLRDGGDSNNRVYNTTNKTAQNTRSPLDDDDDEVITMLREMVARSDILAAECSVPESLYTFDTLQRLPSPRAQQH